MRVRSIVAIVGLAVVVGCASSSSLTKSDFREVREKQKIVANLLASPRRDLDVAVGIIWKGRYREGGGDWKLRTDEEHRERVKAMINAMPQMEAVRLGDLETATVTNRAGQEVARIIAPMDFKLKDGEIKHMRPIFQRASDGQWRMR